jgi:hypothetical protein
MGCDIVEKITKNTHQPLPEGKVGQAEWVVVPYPANDIMLQSTAIYTKNHYICYTKNTLCNAKKQIQCQQVYIPNFTFNWFSVLKSILPFKALYFKTACINTFLVL